MLTFENLRYANEKRAAQWQAGEPAPLGFAAVELAGEVGELCNVIKKVLRFEMGWVGGADPEASRALLEDELADVIISCDLIGIRLGIDLGGAVRRKFNKTSEKHGFEIRILPSGQLYSPRSGA